MVDDNHDVTETLADVLRDEGHEVSTAHSAHEALEQISAFKPAIAIIDIGLPGANGYELAELAREQSGGEALRLIALTGHSGAAARERSKDAGFDAHLVKPVGLDALLDAVSDRSARSP